MFLWHKALVGAMSPEPCSSKHLAAGHSTANLPGSKMDRNGATDPAATTRHGGKLRHDDFKHTTTGQVLLYALPDTITSMIPRDKAPRSVVPAGIAPRGAVPRGILPTGIQVSTTRSVMPEEIKRHNIQGGVTSGGMAPQEDQYPGCDTQRQNIQDSRCTRTHKT